LDTKKPKDLPFEENVDIEFEYKVFMLLDKLKKFKFFIIGGFIILIVAIVAFFLYKEQQQKILNEASKLAYQIKIAYENDNQKKANELIKIFKEKYNDTPFLKVVLSYQLNIEKEKNPEKTESTASQIKRILNTDQLKSGYKEYSAYVLYEKNQLNNALSILGSIDKQYYNHISAQLLTAIILKKKGNKDTAKSIFEELSQKKQFRYFSTIAEENL
jgi:predicted negative regulator of RcsB-dependent stress response